LLSFLEGGFFASALVVGLNYRSPIGNNQPSDVFFQWMVGLGILANMSETAIEKFWVNEVSKSIEFFKSHKNLTKITP